MRDESLLARYDPAKLSAIATAIAQTHGLVPLDVRYEAAAAALRHIHDEWPPRASSRPDDEVPVSVMAMTFTVSAVPATVPNADLFTLTVEARGSDIWAVRHIRNCLNAEGEWDREPGPGERDDHWLARHRFDLNTALRLARAAAPHVTVNGSTVGDALRLAQEMRRARSAAAGPAAGTSGAR